MVYVSYTLISCPCFKILQLIRRNPWVMVCSWIKHTNLQVTQVCSCPCSQNASVLMGLTYTQLSQVCHDAQNMETLNKCVLVNSSMYFLGHQKIRSGLITETECTQALAYITLQKCSNVRNIPSQFCRKKAAYIWAPYDVLTIWEVNCDAPKGMKLEEYIYIFTLRPSIQLSFL